MLNNQKKYKRDLRLIKTYPNITQRVPLKMVASYLGITPEALSRVRNELSKKDNPISFLDVNQGIGFQKQ